MGKLWELGLTALGVVPFLFLGGGHGGGGDSASRSELFTTEWETVNEAIRTGDTATMEHVQQTFIKYQLGMMTLISQHKDGVLKMLTECDKLIDLSTNAAMQEQIVENKKILNELYAGKVDAEQRAKFQQEVGDLYIKLLGDFANQKDELERLYGEEKAKKLQEIVNQQMQGMSAITQAERDYARQFLAANQAQFNQLMTNYLNLNNMAEAERDEMLQRLEKEKQRYANQIHALTEKMKDEDKMFMNLMKVKHDAIENTLDRVDDVYFHDTNNDTIETMAALNAMNEANMTKYKIQKEYEQQMYTMQVDLMAQQMKLDQEAELAELQAETEQQKLESTASYYEEMARLEQEAEIQHEAMEAEMEARKREQNAIVVESVSKVATAQVTSAEQEPADVVRSSGVSAGRGGVVSAIIVALLMWM